MDRKSSVSKHETKDSKNDRSLSKDPKDRRSESPLKDKTKKKKVTHEDTPPKKDKDTAWKDSFLKQNEKKNQ